MRIAFWSTVHGQTGTTTNTLAMALMTALDYRLKILMAHNHFEKSTMETSLLEKKYLTTSLESLNDTGIDALSRSIKFNALNYEDIGDYTTTILKGRMDLLRGTTSTNKELFHRDITSVIEVILNAARQSYDLIFVDVESGYNELSTKIVENADLVVVNLNQNFAVLDDFFSRETGKDGTFYLLGFYDKNSIYNIKAIKRKYKIKENIGLIPYNRAFADACSEGKAVEFFIKNKNVSKDDDNYEFISSARKSVQTLLETLGIDINTKKIGD